MDKLLRKVVTSEWTPNVNEKYSQQDGKRINKILTSTKIKLRKKYNLRRQDMTISSM